MAISPKEVLAKQEELGLTAANRIPSFVYDAFDKLIAEKFDPDSKKSTVMQNAVVALIESEMSDPDDFKYSWLDVEPKYRSLGWNVTYYKQPYYETGNNYFVFAVKE